MCARMMMLGALILFSQLFSQSIYELNKYLENPSMPAENQEPPHTPLVVYQTFEQAKTDDWEYSPYYLSLNGDWKFSCFWNPLEAPQNFYEPSFDVSDWDDIRVPSVWQMMGYDRNMYRTIPSTLHSFPQSGARENINPTGCYRTTFEIPENWVNRQIFLHFDGIQSCAFVWLNGEYVGYEQGGATAAEFNITSKVTPGVNTLAVQVFRWNFASNLESQDGWSFSGIYRRLYLFSTPNIHVRDFFIKTDLDEHYKNATLSVDINLVKYAEVTFDKIRLEGVLFDDAGDTVLVVETSALLNQAKHTPIKLQTTVLNPLKWSAENPNLYTLVLSLFDAENQAVEFLAEKIGFRELEKRNGLVLMNGVAVDFMGVNRHEIDAHSGCSLTEEKMRQDLELMKQFNVNAVRLVHQPNDPLWYDLCDEYGIYILDEINAGCLNNDFEVADDRSLDKYFLDSFERMVQRDKNHPSVVMWSAGGDARSEQLEKLVADYILTVDPSRFVMHTDVGDGTVLGDSRGTGAQTPTLFFDLAENSDKAIIGTEYVHATGNGLRNLDEFWELFRTNDNLQGGFICEWIDLAIWSELAKTVDISQYGHDGFLMGRPQVVHGKTGSAIALSGLDDWIEFYRDPILDVTRELTLECWIYPRDWFGANPLITKGEAYALSQFHADSLEFYVAHPSGKSRVTARLPINWAYNWHHVAGVYDGDSLKLYLDAHKVAAAPGFGLIQTGYFPLCIGRDAQRHNEHYAGWLSNSIFDNVRIYGRALMPEELGLEEKPLRNDAIVWLDFDEYEKMANHLSCGLGRSCCNGLLFPDRSLQPEIWQMKKSHQPVKIELLDYESGNIKITNYFDFTNLNGFEGRWSLVEDTIEMASDTFSANIAPHSFDYVLLEFPKIIPKPGASYWLTLSFHLRSSTIWAAQGHEIAFEQFELPYFLAEQNTLQDLPAPRILENEDLLRVYTADVSYTFNKQSGLLDYIFYNGLELVSKGPHLNVRLSPLLNERSITAAEDWRTRELDRLRHSLQSLSVDTVDNYIQVTAVLTSTTLDSSTFQNEFTYSIFSDGELLLNYRVSPLDLDNVEYLPKMGLQLALPRDYYVFTWFGRGPFETYPDRKTGARFGIYSCSIDDLYVPYSTPQDHGNRTDVRWFLLQNRTGAGLKIVPDEPLNVSVTNLINMDRAEYVWQLQKGQTTFVNIDKSMSGVSGAAATAHPFYRTLPQEYFYSIRFIPIK